MSEEHGANELDGESSTRSEAEQPSSADQRQTAGSGRWLAVVALLVALAASAGVGWLIWQQTLETEPEEEQPTAASVEALEAVAEQAQTLSERVDQLAEQQAGFEDDLSDLDGARGDLRQSLREQADDFERLSEQFGSLESELSDAIRRLDEAAGDRREVDREMARRLHLMEAAAMLRTGQQRLELAEDFAAARNAFRRAYRLLRSLDDPRINRARGEVARELEALEAVEEPDWMALHAKVDRLQAMAAEWPARPGQELPGAQEDDARGEEAELGFWSRFGSTLTGLVRVQPRDAVPMTEEVLDAIRGQVQIRLAAADLALAQRDLEGLGRQLDHVIDLMEQGFDPRDSGVERGRSLIDELRSAEAAEVPALGSALTEINRLLDES
ncbi:uroporphyrinogen-III C-methyltransferase [Wenzhouxiangella sp. AB-CW3]|uniref:uroporphyrinogen-III C-methyltransferase n=1 Tax=Wenzhouxiangella sp. AB-CW3 TaxID=2771012 RepID=UPI00168BECF5|nr:uroporphyrinogen-III C-methyltransferase [Wenzhouxiangella sp. AB-CW3]QOC23653.1 uroporphyrinogen-III C-methyltransferase [Wenzhouxiangella sp. AB-CW3]